MSFLNKTYNLDKDENFKEFVENFGLPDEHLKVLLNFKPSHTLKKEGDQYILSMTTPGGSIKDLKFIEGVEFDEEATPGNFAKTKFTVEGNVVTQVQTFGDGLCLTYRREFSDDNLAIVIKSNKWDVTACRYYKAV